MTNFPSDEEPLLRREDRLVTNLPVCLTIRRSADSSEVIPAILIDLSALGASILTDIRFSSLLPPACGSRFEVEFFFDEIEVRRADVTVERIEKRDDYQIVMGCSFVHLSGELRTAIRHQVVARLATSHR
jgi:hypothetical protein